MMGHLFSPLVVASTSGLTQVGPEHYFWLFSNLLIFCVVIGGIALVIYGIRKTQTLKTGAGPWIIAGFIFMIPPIVNEVFDELEIIVDGNFYPNELYDFIFTYSPIILFVGAVLLVVGLYRQFLVGEHLSQSIITKNIELEAAKQELSEYAHQLNHDLRNELSLIISTLDLMEKEPSQEYIEVIRKRSQQISSLIQRSIVLADAGLVIGEKKALVDFNSLVQDVAEATIPSTITLKSSNLPELPADRDKIYQIMKNLFENAVLHSQPNTIEISVKTTNDIIFLLITNDGIPVPEELRGKLFRDDLSNKEAGRGRGLQIVKNIVTAHGWKITIDKTGTIFIIAIPRNS